MPIGHYAINIVSDDVLAKLRDIPEAACAHGGTPIIVYDDSEIEPAIVRLLNCMPDKEANVVVEKLLFSSNEEEARSVKSPTGLGIQPVLCETIIAKRIRLQNGELIPLEPRSLART